MWPEKYKGKSDLGVVHLWREDLPVEIKAVLDEYEDVFPKDLPPGLPPDTQGATSSRLSLKTTRPQCTSRLYKLSPLELAEAKKQIEYMLEHGFIRPSGLSLWRPKSCLHQIRIADYASALIIYG